MVPPSLATTEGQPASSEPERNQKKEGSS